MNVIVICSGLKTENQNLQPWKYITKLCEGLSSSHDVSIINLSVNDKIILKSNYQIINIDAPAHLNKDKILDKLNHLSPDLIIMQIGPTSIFLYNILTEIKCKKIGLWMGTRYELKDIFEVDISYLMDNMNITLNLLINSLIPRFQTAKLVNFFDTIVTLNMHNLEYISSLHIPNLKIVRIPRSIDDEYLDAARKERIDLNTSKETRLGLGVEGDEILLTYMGGPSEFRGVKLLIDSFSIVSKKRKIKLLLLLRNIDLDDDIKTQKILNRLNYQKLEEIVIVKSGFLDKDDLNRYLLSSDYIALPFRIVEADVPLSFLECMSLSKLIISTRVDGITELLSNDRGYIVSPNDAWALARTIDEAIDDPNKGKKTGTWKEHICPPIQNGAI